MSLKRRAAATGWHSQSTLEIKWESQVHNHMHVLLMVATNFWPLFRGNHRRSAQMLGFKRCLPAISKSIQLNSSLTKISSEEAFERKYGGERSLLLCSHLYPRYSCNIPSMGGKEQAKTTLWLHQPFRWDSQCIQVTEQHRNHFCSCQIFDKNIFWHSFVSFLATLVALQFTQSKKKPVLAKISKKNAIFWIFCPIFC